MKKTCLLVHWILSFEGTSYKRIQDIASLPVRLFSCFFTSHQNLHHQISFLTFTEKRYSSQIFIFNVFTQTHHLFAKRNKSFLLMLPKFGKFLHKWLYVTYSLMPMNKLFQTTKYINKCWERSVKRKSNISFTVIKNYLLISNVF